jgi:hypothetical protein
MVVYGDLRGAFRCPVSRTLMALLIREAADQAWADRDRGLAKP